MKTFYINIKNIHLWFLSVLIFLISCNNSSKQNPAKNSHETDKITVDIHQTDNKYNFDDFFQYSHSIVLQTNNESLISKINKLQIINEKLYILDKTESIFEFDLKGNFLRKINHKGQSGHEYIRMTDMEIDKDGNIYMCDFLGGKILKYDKDDNFIEAIKLSVKGNNFKVLANKHFALNLQNGSSSDAENNCYNYICYENDNIICKAIPFNKNMQGLSFSFGYGSSSFYSYKDNILVTSLFNDTIYTINENFHLSPYIVYDFKRKKPDLKSSKQEVEQYIRNQQEGNDVSSIYCFSIFNDFFFISYDYQGKSNFVISEKNKLPVFAGKFSLDKNGLYIIPITYLSDSSTPHQLATVIHPESLPRLLKNRKNSDDSLLLQELNNLVHEEDNPILVFYDWIYQR